MLTFLYIVWFAPAVVFFIMAIWAQLEIWSGKAVKGEVKSYLKQMIFVLICAGVTVMIEQYFLADFVMSYLDPFVPLGLAQIVLFPLILLLSAKLIGGSKPIQLQSNRLNQTKRKRR